MSSVGSADPGPSIGLMAEPDGRGMSELDDLAAPDSQTGASWSTRMAFEAESELRGAACGSGLAGPLADPYGGPSHTVRYYELTGEVITVCDSCQGPVVLLGRAESAKSARRLLRAFGVLGADGRVLPVAEAWHIAGGWPSTHRGLSGARWRVRAKRSRAWVRRRASAAARSRV